MCGNPWSFPGDLESAGDALKSRESPAQSGRLVIYVVQPATAELMSIMPIRSFFSTAHNSYEVTLPHSAVINIQCDSKFQNKEMHQQQNIVFNVANAPTLPKIKGSCV